MIATQMLTGDLSKGNKEEVDVAQERGRQHKSTRECRVQSVAEI